MSKLVNNDINILAGATATPSIDASSKDVSVVSIGSVLRAARSKKCYSLDDVAAQTNISLYVLKAFESGAKPKIASIYTRGYLRTLAQLLELEAQPLIDLYEYDPSQLIKEEMNSSAVNEAPDKIPSHTRAIDAKPTNFGVMAGWSRSLQVNMRTVGATFWRTGAFAAIPMVCLCMLAFAYHVIHDEINGGSKAVVTHQHTESADQPSIERAVTASDTIAVLSDVPIIDDVAAMFGDEPISELISTVDASISSRVASSEMNSRANRPFTASLVEAPGAAKMVDMHRTQDRLVIEVLEDSWIDVRDREGNPLYRNLARAGRRIDVSGELPFALHVGNVPGLVLELNGEHVAINRYRADNSARLTLASN